MEKLIIGTVLKPQGIRGEIKVKSLLDSPEDFKYFKTVFLGEESYKVLSCRLADGGAVFLSLRGIADRNAAELLRGKAVSADREEAPDLEEGRYYIVDLIGCAVETEEGEVIGTLKEVTSAATDIYTILSGEKEILFPAVKGVVQSVDLESKKILVNKKAFEEVAVK